MYKSCSRSFSSSRIANVPRPPSKCAVGGLARLASTADVRAWFQPAHRKHHVAGCVLLFDPSDIRGQVRPADNFESQMADPSKVSEVRELLQSRDKSRCVARHPAIARVRELLQSTGNSDQVACCSPAIDFRNFIQSATKRGEIFTFSTTAWKRLCVYTTRGVSFDPGKKLRFFFA